MQRRSNGENQYIERAMQSIFYGRQNLVKDFPAVNRLLLPAITISVNLEGERWGIEPSIIHPSGFILLFKFPQGYVVEPSNPVI